MEKYNDLLFGGFNEMNSELAGGQGQIEWFSSYFFLFSPRLSYVHIPMQMPWNSSF